MYSVEASAKTRKEAIQAALDKLGVEMHDVEDIEIIDEGSKGLFGIGARPTRVRVKVKKAPPGARKRDRQRDPQRDQERDPLRDRKPRREASQARKTGREDAPAAGPAGDRNQDQDAQEDDRPKRPRRSRSVRRPGRPGRGGDNGGAAARGEDRREEKPREPQQERKREQSPRPPRDAGEKGTGEEDLELAPISDEQGREAAALLQEVIQKMGLAATVAYVRSDDGAAKLDVASEDSALLIGRKGRNLQAMQYLINRFVSRGENNDASERLVVDIEGYIERRKAALQEMAENMARKATESGRDMRLKPLSPQERRIVHLTLQDDEEVRTFSLGDSLFRTVVISPRNKRGGSGGGGSTGGRRGGRSGRGRRGGRSGRGRGGDRGERTAQSAQGGGEGGERGGEGGERGGEGGERGGEGDAS